MIIDTILKINTASFMTTMGKAVQSVQSLINVAQGLSAKLDDAFNVGSNLSHLSKQTDEMPSSLMVLKRAFGDTGVGADAVGGTIAKLRKSLSGVNERGLPTVKTFERLGLSIDELKKMDAVGQFDAVGKAIMGVQNPSERSAAAIDIFGKSGQNMVGLFASGSAFEQAKQSLGGLPDMMDRSAHAFENISTRISHIKEKSQGFWVGFAEGVLPVANKITSYFDRIDLSGLGLNFGETLSAIIEMFNDAGIGDSIRDAFELGAKEGANAIVSVVHQLGSVFDLTLRPITEKLSAAFGVGLQTVMKWMGMIDEVESFSDQVQNYRDYWDDVQIGDAKAPVLFDTSELGVKVVKDISERFKKAREIVRENIAAIEDDANNSAIKIGMEVDETLFVEKLKNATLNITSDSLAKIGGFVGGFNPMAGLTEISTNQLNVQRGMLSKLNSIDSKSGRAVFA